MSTRQTARVLVKNETGKPIAAVSLLHKYSDNYKNRQVWGIIPDDHHGSEELEVEYNTGFWTTGKDWWVITWYSADMKTLYYSDPQNFRGLFDFLDKVSPTAIAGAAGAIAAALTSPTGAGAVAAAAAAAAIAKTTTDALFNSETTSGFKQHILREEDANRVMKIILHSDLRITIQSVSGSSETGVSSHKV